MDIDLLISEVFARPSLWDQKDKNHHNRYVLDKYWDEVATKVNSTRKAARNRWKGLRDQFRIVINRCDPKPGTADPDYKGEWRWFQSLLFLKDQFTLRGSESTSLRNENEESFEYNIQESDNDSSSKHSVLNQYDSFQSVELTDVAENPAANYRLKLKRSTNQQIAQTLQEVEREDLQYFEEKKMRIEEDEDMSFFKSLLPHVRTFSPYEKMEYRMRIMKLTQDFLKPSHTEQLPFHCIGKTE